MKDVLSAIRDSLPKHMAFVVKMNSYDGFKSGITREEGIMTAKIIEECGADAIVVSGGFVSKAPMYILRGSMPTGIMAYFMNDPVKRFFVRVFGKQLIPTLKFEEGYFMENAKQIKQAVNIPIVLVGGMNSIDIIDKAMDEGFDFVAIARALIENPDFINDLKSQSISKSECTICNYCIAKMYSHKMSCHLNETDIPPALKSKIDKLHTYSV
jgi:2,4-dienoyl-CoA reductase-like NADH-dependent reductase (Old Yellow Enzyme family)